MIRHRSLIGTIFRVVLVTVVATIVSFHDVPQARAQDSETPEGLEVDGTGAYEINSLMSAWGTPMFDSSNPVNLSYIASGDEDGRTQFALGQVDFAVSGMPLSAQDKQSLAARNVSVIAAPLAMAAAAFVYEAPTDLGLQIFTPTDPTDPESDGTFSNYSTDLHFDPGLLARTMSGEESYNTYRDADFLTDLALPAGAQFQIPNIPQGVVARSDAGAANFYLESYVTKYGLADYNLHLTEQLLPQNVQSESWPFLDMPSRAGPKPAADLLASGTNPSGSSSAVGGVFAMLDPTIANQYVNDQTAKRSGNALLTGAPGRLSVLPLQNGAGEWVTPTPASITAAGAGGNGTPMYGLTDVAPGAYPFTWIDDLYVPSSGLSIDKTNAIATFLRYATGPGQALAATVNEGAHPAPLVAQAAGAADQIVKGNCPAAGGTTKTAADGGPDWPTGVAPPAGGALICVAPPGAPTTTVPQSASSSGTPSVDGSSGFGPSAFNSSPATASVSKSVSSSAGTIGSTGDSTETTGSDGTTASSSDAGAGSNGGAELPLTTTRVDLPLGSPDDGQFSLDRFTTIVLGGPVFIVLRSIVRPRLGGTR